MVVVMYVYFSVDEYCVYHVPNIIAYWITEHFIKALVHIMWPQANQIAWNVLPAGALNRIKHTLLYVMHTWWQANNGSRAQEREGHVLNIEILRSHVTMDYTVSTHLSKPNNGLDRWCNALSLVH